jgi:spermidine synthase
MTSSTRTRYVYFFTVFFTGAAVLIIEVAAIRMLAPYFGSSLSVLSSVLTVVLAALSLGYFIGGRIADRMPFFLPLYTIIGTAGILMLALQTLSLYLLPFSNQIFSITTGPLFLSLILFFVPAFLLGIDSPFVIKLLTQTVPPDQAGAVVGSTFFWSTIGSIVGSLSAGFWLIPNLGLTLTITTVSVALIAVAIVAATALHYLTRDDTTQPTLPFSPLWLALVGATVGIAFAYHTLSFTPTSTLGTTLYRADGYYSNLHIYDRTVGTSTYRFLKNDVNNSSAIILGSNEIVFPYAQFANIFTANNPNAKNYLVLGGGSYTIPRHMFLTHPDLDISVVETEGRLFSLAHQYFELPISPRITNYEMDARVFLQSTTTTFDVIFSDIMNSGHFLPPHVATVEFFESFKKRLSPEGIGIINFIGSLETTSKTLTGSMIQTISSVFPNLTIVALNGTNYEGIQNILFLVRHDNLPITIPDDLMIKNIFTGTTTPATAMVVDKSTLPLTNQTLFTDDKSELEPLVFAQFSKL